MKTNPECFPCFLEQGLRVAKLCECGEEKKLEVMRELSSLLATMDLEQSPPANAIKLYAALHRILENDDPYGEAKEMENAQALANIEELRREVTSSENPLFAAIGFAIAANIIDYGTASTFDSAAKLDGSRDGVFTVDHRSELKEKLDSLKKGDSVLYLCDNCGEIVYDTLLVELLTQRGLDVTVAVRGGPIINDALIDDAITVGMDRFGRIITNGVACPGSSLDHCSDEFRERFQQADLVISKGQGNFETLSEVEREVFFLLTIKCKVLARHLAERLNDGTEVTGNGEMVILHHRG